VHRVGNVAVHEDVAWFAAAHGRFGHATICASDP
jgi:hypothetical protein